jgi:RNA polymerase sigma-B factor
MNNSRNRERETSVDQSDTEDLIARAQSASGSERSTLEEVILRRFMPMTRQMSLQFSRKDGDTDDLAQIANMALIKALRRFNPSRGSFAPYAKATISGELKNYLRDFSWSVKPPRRVQAMHSQIYEVSSELAQESGELPTCNRLAEYLGVEVSDVSEAVSATNCHRPSSIDQPIGETGRTLGDNLCTNDQPYAEIEDQVTLLQICTDLTDEDRNLIRLRFFECLSQREIAEEIHVSQMQVSRRLTEVIERLRVKAQGELHVA